MWVFVHFDLPTTTKKDRKEYARFRKALLDDGFNMLQYSIYIRHCSSRENAAVHKERARKALPKLGHVVIFELTDVQFGRIEMFYGKKPEIPKDQPRQLELF